jgi:hypothetical protein
MPLFDRAWEPGLLVNNQLWEPGLLVMDRSWEPGHPFWQRRFPYRRTTGRGSPVCWLWIGRGSLVTHSGRGGSHTVVRPGVGAQSALEDFNAMALMLMSLRALNGRSNLLNNKIASSPYGSLQGQIEGGFLTRTD